MIERDLNEYFRQRIAEAERLSAEAIDPRVKATHTEFAALYRAHAGTVQARVTPVGAGVALLKRV